MFRKIRKKIENVVVGIRQNKIIKNQFVKQYKNGNHSRKELKNMERILKNLKPYAVSLNNGGRGNIKSNDSFDSDLNVLIAKTIDSFVEFANKNYDVKKIVKLENELMELQSNYDDLDKKFRFWKSKKGDNFYEEKYHNLKFRFEVANSRFGYFYNKILESAVDGLCVIDVRDNEYFKFKNGGDFICDYELKTPKPIPFGIDGMEYTPQNGIDEEGKPTTMDWVVKSVEHDTYEIKRADWE